MNKRDAEIQVRSEFRTWFAETYPEHREDWHTARVTMFVPWLYDRRPDLFEFRSDNVRDDIRRWGIAEERSTMLEWISTHGE